MDPHTTPAFENQRDHAWNLSYEEAYEAFGDIESGFKNLEQTVPWHARDWWDAHEANWRQEFAEARERFDQLNKPSEEQWSQVKNDYRELLGRLGRHYAEAKEGLGARTIAGRAKGEPL